MFKEQTMIQLQYPKSKSNRRMLKILHQAKANPGAKLHKTQRQRPSSSTHSVVENSAIHYSALFTAHPSVMHASSSIRTEGLHIPQHKLTLPRYTSKAAPTPVYTTATVTSGASITTKKAPAREEAHGSGSAVPAQLQEARGSSTNSAAGHASAEAAQQAPAPRTHNVPEGVGRAAVSAAAQPQSKKEQTALSLQRHPPLTKKKSKTGLICSACSLSGAIHRGRYASYSFRPHGIVCEHRVAHCTAGQKSKVRSMTEGNPWRKVPSFVAQDHDTSITAWHHFTKYRSRWCVKAGERFLPTVYQSS
eukprot:gene9230-6483_t